MRKTHVLFILLLCAMMLACTAPAEPVTPTEAIAEATPLRTETPAPTEAPTPEPTATPELQPFSLLWIPDTQNMTVDGYAPVEAMVDWAAAHRDEYNLLYAVHTGDIVNGGLRNVSWERIAPTMRRLAETVPLITAAGNHDIGRHGDYSFYLNWRFDTPLPEGQLFEGGRGSYALLDTDVGEFLLVAIGAYPDDASYAWLNEVFQQYPERIGILVIHDYLKPRGEHTSYGGRIFEHVVKGSSNLRFVICGHNGGVGYRVDELDDDGDGTADRSVYQMMINFQADEKRTGYLRILTFCPDGSLLVDTYSPYLDDHDYYAEPIVNRPESFTIENAF